MELQTRCLIKVIGELVVETRQELRERFFRLLEAGERHFCIDLSQCTRFDSSGVGVLTSIDKKARENGGSVVLRGLSKEFDDFLHVTKLDELFTIQSSRVA